jgi:hypothetical protein
METKLVPSHFHLTVARDGIVSLWDREVTARMVANGGETYLLLELTPNQQSQVRAAQALATADNQPKED